MNTHRKSGHNSNTTNEIHEPNNSNFQGIIFIGYFKTFNDNFQTKIIMGRKVTVYQSDIDRLRSDTDRLRNRISELNNTIHNLNQKHRDECKRILDRSEMMDRRVKDEMRHAKRCMDEQIRMEEQRRMEERRRMEEERRREVRRVMEEQRRREEQFKIEKENMKEKFKIEKEYMKEQFTKEKENMKEQFTKEKENIKDEMNEQAKQYKKESALDFHHIFYFRKLVYNSKTRTSILLSLNIWSSKIIEKIKIITN